MGLGIKPYERGLLELGNGGYAWLQPDGGWGWSNAGLVVDGDQSLLVDTLFDEKLTAEMLAAMRRAAPAAARIDRLVNTHANGDHCNGNGLVGSAEIIASQACVEEMAHENPQTMAHLVDTAPAMGDVGEFFLHCFGAFDFHGIERRTPNHSFEGALTLTVGDKTVELKEVGPAHTRGDVLVHVPADGLAFTGDILFIEGHPIIWAGPVQNWIEACDHLLRLAPDTIVSGHGPVTDRRGVLAVRDYLRYVRDQARLRFDAGMTPLEAALDIQLRDYESWGDGERIVVNVATLFKEFAGDPAPHDVTELFGLMARVHRDRR